MSVRWLDYGLLALGVFLLFAISGTWIPHLGVEYDEAHFHPTALKIAQGAEERINPPHGITVAHRPVPILTMPYVGTLDALIYAAAYASFGHDPVVPRYVNTALGAAMFALVWLCCRQVAGPWAGAFALGVLLADLEWMLHAPTNYGPLVVQQVSTAGALLALLAWWKQGRGVYFLLAMGALAMAFHEKLTFLWILSSLVLAAAFTHRRETFALRHWRLYLGGFVLGYGKQNSGLKFDFGVLLSERVKAVDLMLRGTWMLDFTAGPAPGFLRRGPALLLLFLLSFFIPNRFAQLCSLSALGVWLWNFAFPDAGRMHHVLLMSPLWVMAIAIGFGVAKPLVRVLLLALLAWAGLDATRAYAWYAPRVEATGGANHWTSFTREAAEWLREHPELYPVTLHWGLARPLFVLSGGAAEVEERYFETLGEFSPETRQQLTQLLGRRRAVWLYSDVTPVYKEQWQRLLGLASELNLRPREVALFPSPDDRYHLRAYRFDEPEPQSSLGPREEITTGREIALPKGFDYLRLTLEEGASGETDFLSVDWLDAGGQVIKTDHRPLYWYPVIRSPRTFDFAPELWPAKFSRTVLLAGTAARARISFRLPGAAPSLQVASTEPETQAFRIELLKPLEELRRIAAAASPPAQPAGLRKPELVDLRGMDAGFRFDIRYATSNNFMGAALYSQPGAYLQKPAAEALVRVHRALAAAGYGLLIHDAYRPWAVTKMFWEGTPPKFRNFVANPEKGSKHNRGCAVDLTLYELGSGKAVEMPSGYDEFSERAFANYQGGTAKQRELRDLLRRAMEAEGFTVNPEEWWHFDYKDWQLYPILNLSFEQLGAH
jgi:D-alanyl-D-alanine dipeptidase